MKVTKSLREIYDAARADMPALESHTNDLLRPFAAARRWHYESRIKSLESFALKIESGRYRVPAELEDLFAAMLVVPSQQDVADMPSVLGAELGIVVAGRRPPRQDQTSKPPDSFRFDELRMYVRHGQPKGLPPRPYLDRLFEIQVKTFLQHAWGIATHDKIYKAERANWGRERIAFETKAALEHVEASIANIDSFDGSYAFPSYEPYTRRNAILEILRLKWTSDRLPTDLKRASEIIDELLVAIGLAPNNLAEALDAAEASGGGATALDLSPVQAIVGALFALYPASFANIPNRGDRSKRVLVTPEMLENNPALANIAQHARVNI